MICYTGYRAATRRLPSWSQARWWITISTWRYDATTHCRAEAAAVLCQCAACDQKAAQGSVDRCGTCQMCLLAAFTAAGH